MSTENTGDINQDADMAQLRKVISMATLSLETFCHKHGRTPQSWFDARQSGADDEQDA